MAPQTLRLFVGQFKHEIGRGLLGRYDTSMAKYQFTDYFENEVRRKRPYLKKEWCTRDLDAPIRSEPQAHNRWRFWDEIPKLDHRCLRVVTLEDRVTIHNAFPDRRFKP